jgi:adenosylhomocysteine nucleosidase
MSAMLVTFAVREEARPFQKLASRRAGLSVVVTGMGARNAERSLRSALAQGPPEIVLTCGFAGSLNSELPVGSLVFSADEGFPLTHALIDHGARSAEIHCAEKVAVTAAEKRALREKTGADAVEMESGVIRRICRAHKIPSATVRVISDAVDENLPLDFNRLLDGEQNLSYARLLCALLMSPGSIPGLIRLQRRTRAAADQLARILVKAIESLDRDSK